MYLDRKESVERQQAAWGESFINYILPWLTWAVGQQKIREKHRLMEFVR